MKTNFIAAAFALLLAAPLCRAEVITNRDILDMLDRGFTPESVLSAIARSQCDFNTEVEVLNAMRGLGVPRAVISAMVERSGKRPGDAGVPLARGKAASGIFAGGSMAQLLPQEFGGVRSGKLSKLSGGLLPSGKSMVLVNSESGVAVNGPKPSFVFRLSPGAVKDAAHHSADWWFLAAASPRDFALVSLECDRKGNVRLLPVESVNGEGLALRPVAKRCLPFFVESLADGSFKVTPKQELDTGEYAFVFVGKVAEPFSTLYSNNAAFDFSVVE